jgi:site-specific recombinase XerD
MMDVYRTSAERLPSEPITVVGRFSAMALSPRANAYARLARAAGTKRSYHGDLARFGVWCLQQGACPLPASPTEVANYLSSLADNGRKPSTIGRALAAISAAHRVAGFPSPRADEHVRQVMKGIRRALGVAPSRKAPLMIQDVRRILDVLSDCTKGLRDRAVLVLGFACACRRAELVSLDVADLKLTALGLEVTLRTSKTDQERQGASIGVPFGADRSTCPVRAVQAWLKAAHITEGPVFRPVDRHGHISARRLSAKAVASLIKKSARLIGLNPDQYGGHSLRAGFITSAMMLGKSEATVMKQSRHKSVSVFRSYIRHTDLFAQNAAAGIGL